MMNMEKKLRKEGHEFGSTTGRPRRCGWFDAVVARYAISLNGIDAMAVTKLDVLDRFDTLKVCTGYKYKGNTFKEMPADLDILENGEPVYTDFEGGIKVLWRLKTLINCLIKQNFI